MRAYSTAYLVKCVCINESNIINILHEGIRKAYVFERHLQDYPKKILKSMELNEDAEDEDLDISIATMQT